MVAKTLREGESERERSIIINVGDTPCNLTGRFERSSLTSNEVFLSFFSPLPLVDKPMFPSRNNGQSEWAIAGENKRGGVEVGGVGGRHGCKLLKGVVCRTG